MNHRSRIEPLTSEHGHWNQPVPRQRRKLQHVSLLHSGVGGSMRESGTLLWGNQMDDDRNGNKPALGPIAGREWTPGGLTGPPNAFRRASIPKILDFRTDVTENFRGND
jgi:hypothetical protein